MQAEKVAISHQDKVLFPDTGFTKRDIACYCEKIAGYMLPHIRQRPLTFKRFTEGIGKEGFFNKQVPDYFPDYVVRTKVPLRSKPGETIAMATADEAADLVYFAGQDVIEVHVALATIRHLEKPDQMVFDLDPSDDEFEKVRQSALTLKRILDEKNWPSFVKTTGSRGVHIHIPLKPVHDFGKVKRVAKELAQQLQESCPDLTTLEHRKNKRGEKVFIDYLRNDYGMTVIAPYSLRALEGAPVATPIDWEELRNTKLGPQRYRLKTIFCRLGQKDDPWKHFAHHRIALSS